MYLIQSEGHVRHGVVLLPFTCREFHDREGVAQGVEHRRLARRIRPEDTGYRIDLLIPPLTLAGTQRTQGRTCQIQDRFVTQALVVRCRESQQQHNA